MTASVVFIIFGFMATIVKSSNDGHWYYDQSQWSLVFYKLCDALDCLSELDMHSEVGLALDHLADVVSSKMNEK